MSTHKSYKDYIEEKINNLNADFNNNNIKYSIALSNYVFDQAEEFNSDNINKKLKLFLENDRFCYNILQGYTLHTTWICNWYNDDGIVGYKEGDSVWVNIQSTENIIRLYWKQIKAFVDNNIYLRSTSDTLCPDLSDYNFNSIKLTDKKISGYVKVIKGGNINGFDLPPLFYISDEDEEQAKTPSLRISLKDNNKDIPTLKNSDSWFTVKTSEEVTKQLDDIVDSIIDSELSNHVENFHKVIEKIRETQIEDIENLVNLNLSNAKKMPSDSYTRTVHNEDIIHGFDYVDIDVARRLSKNSNDVVEYRTYISGKLEHIGSINLEKNAELYRRTDTNSQYIIYFDWCTCDEESKQYLKSHLICKHTSDEIPPTNQAVRLDISTFKTNHNDYDDSYFVTITKRIDDIYQLKKYNSIIEENSELRPINGYAPQFDSSDYFIKISESSLPQKDYSTSLSENVRIIDRQHSYVMIEIDNDLISENTRINYYACGLCGVSKPIEDEPEHTYDELTKNDIDTRRKIKHFLYKRNNTGFEYTYSLGEADYFNKIINQKYNDINGVYPDIIRGLGYISKNIDEFSVLTNNTITTKPKALYWDINNETNLIVADDDTDLTDKHILGYVYKTSEISSYVSTLKNSYNIELIPVYRYKDTNNKYVFSTLSSINTSELSSVYNGTYNNIDTPFYIHKLTDSAYFGYNNTTEVIIPDIPDIPDIPVVPDDNEYYISDTPYIGIGDIILRTYNFNNGLHTSTIDIEDYNKRIAIDGEFNEDTNIDYNIGYSIREKQYNDSSLNKLTVYKNNSNTNKRRYSTLNQDITNYTKTDESLGYVYKKNVTVNSTNIGFDTFLNDKEQYTNTITYKYLPNIFDIKIADNISDYNIVTLSANNDDEHLFLVNKSGISQTQQNSFYTINKNVYENAYYEMLDIDGLVDIPLHRYTNNTYLFDTCWIRVMPQSIYNEIKENGDIEKLENVVRLYCLRTTLEYDNTSQISYTIDNKTYRPRNSCMFTTNRSEYLELRDKTIVNDSNTTIKIFEEFNFLETDEPVYVLTRYYPASKPIYCYENTVIDNRFIFTDNPATKTDFVWRETKTCHGNGSNQLRWEINSRKYYGIDDTKDTKYVKFYSWKIADELQQKEDEYKQKYGLNSPRRPMWGCVYTSNYWNLNNDIKEHGVNVDVFTPTNTQSSYNEFINIRSIIQDNKKLLSPKNPISADSSNPINNTDNNNIFKNKCDLFFGDSFKNISYIDNNSSLKYTIQNRHNLCTHMEFFLATDTHTYYQSQTETNNNHLNGQYAIANLGNHTPVTNNNYDDYYSYDDQIFTNYSIYGKNLNDALSVGFDSLDFKYPEIDWDAVEKMKQKLEYVRSYYRNNNTYENYSGTINRRGDESVGIILHLFDVPKTDFSNLDSNIDKHSFYINKTYTGFFMNEINFKKYCRDLKKTGLLQYASCVVIGDEFNNAIYLYEEEDPDRPYLNNKDCITFGSLQNNETCYSNNRLFNTFWDNISNKSEKYRNWLRDYGNYNGPIGFSMYDSTKDIDDTFNGCIYPSDYVFIKYSHHKMEYNDIEESNNQIKVSCGDKNKTTITNISDCGIIEWIATSHPFEEKDKVNKRYTIWSPKIVVDSYMQRRDNYWTYNLISIGKNIVSLSQYDCLIAISNNNINGINPKYRGVLGL